MQNLQLGMMLAIAFWLALFQGQQTPNGSPPPSPTPRLLRVKPDVMRGNLLRQINPIYPKRAKANHLQGDVLLIVVIDREGNTKVEKVASGDPLLAEAAVEAVKQWKYMPYVLNGEPIAVESYLKIQFHL